MTKAKTLLTLSLLLAGVAASFAQPPGSGSPAVDEGIRRQAAKKELRDVLVQADATQRRHDLQQAAKLYDAAWDKVVYVGEPQVSMEAEVTKAGLASVRLELARAAQRRGQLLEASSEIKDVLRVDPHNLSALEFERANEQMIAAQKGRVPDKETLEMLPAIAEDRAKAATLVRDAAVLFEMKKLDEASAKLKQARAVDPSNQSIYYYWNLIQEARYLEAQNKRDVASRHQMV